jgi:hypothetical protein
MRDIICSIKCRYSYPSTVYEVMWRSRIVSPLDGVKWFDSRRHRFYLGKKPPIPLGRPQYQFRRLRKEQNPLALPALACNGKLSETT